MKTRIENVTILTMNQNADVIENGFIEFDEKITCIGQGQSTNQVDKVIDGNKGIVMPGMINTHTHIGMVPFRTLGDDCKDRLRRFLFPLENECMNEKLAYTSAKYAMAEMLLAGITTFMDMYYFEDVIAKATDEMGMRAFLGETVIDFATCDNHQPYGGLDYAKWFIPKWKDHPLITPFIAPHATNTNNEEALKEANEISKQYNVPISLHVSEMDYEMTYFHEEYQKTPIAFLESIGLLSSRLVAAHCILVNDSDIDLLRKYDVQVAHCIGSNAKAGKGVAPIKDMLLKGVNVGLGTDGPSSGNTLDLFTQFKMFATFHKNHHHDRSLFPSKEIVELGTIKGAKCLGIDNQVGSLEIGKQADLVLIETDSVNMFPLFDYYSALVYSAQPHNVDSVFVNGKCLVKNKKLVYFSLKELKQDLQNEMKEFSKKAMLYDIRN